MKKEADVRSIQGSERKYKHQSNRMKVYDMTYIAVFVVLIIICSWITIPFGTIPVTMQIFAVFLAVGVLGGKRGSLSVFIYLLIGCVGLPVFSGFQGGIGVLFGQSGGYLLGFLPAVLLMWLLETLLGKKWLVQLLGMFTGLIVCYGFGTIWFMLVYMKNADAVSLGTVLGLCLLPFIIPDLVKIGLAYFLTKRLRKVLPII